MCTVCLCVCMLFWSHLQCSYLSKHSMFMFAILQVLPKLWAVVSYLGYILMVLVAKQLFSDKLMHVMTAQSLGAVVRLHKNGYIVYL